MKRAVATGLLSLAGLWALSGCAPLEYGWAARQERTGRFEESLKDFLRLADRHPDSGLAPKALFRAGRLASRVLQDQNLARETFQKIIDRYGDRGDWGPRAEWALFITPNYFPLTVNGEWEEGDSDTGGKNALVRTVCRPLKDDPWGALLARSYYAGGRFVKTLSINRLCRKRGLELREYSEGKDSYTVVLKYPFEKGQTWSSQRDGQKMVYTVEGFAAVKVRAGEFQGCLKVREQAAGAPSWKVDYYAPGVGRVLTTLATEAGEKRNTELLSYNLASGEEIGEDALKAEVAPEKPEEAGKE